MPRAGYRTDRASLVVVYSYGDFTAATNVARSDDPAAPPIQITRASCVPANKIEAFFKNPFANLDAAHTAPLKIEKAQISTVPDPSNGWLVAIALYVFMAFYAIGPGVCVWLALSELMPTRIRSNGMSIALVINQVVSTTLAAIFLPVVSNYGYSTIFFLFAGFTVIYFITAAFFLPETKGQDARRDRRALRKRWEGSGVGQRSEIRLNCRLLLHQEPVTDAVHCHKVPRNLWVRLKFIAKFTDVCVHRARVRVFGVPPYRSEQGISREGSIGILQEE